MKNSLKSKYSHLPHISYVVHLFMTIHLIATILRKYYQGAIA